MAKKKLDTLKKTKLIFSGELLLFFLVFAIIGSLILAEVIEIKEWKRIAFSYVPFAGGAWIIADFLWTAISKKRRLRKPLIDKILVLPAGIMVISFDIYAFVNGMVHTDVTSPLFGYIIGSDLLYLACVYIFEAFYHYKHPLPEVYEAVLEIEEEEKKKNQPVQEVIDNQSESERKTEENIEEKSE